MKKLILTYAFFVFSITLNAQEKMSCAINGEIIEFTVSGNEIYVGFNEG